MCSLLLKKALPFALTFILGSLIGGLFKFVGVGGRSYYEARAFHYGYGEGHSCRMRYQRRYLVAESKPLDIIYKPVASLPAPGSMTLGVETVSAKVTFGADGKVQEVEPGTRVVRRGDVVTNDEAAFGVAVTKPMWDEVERAARLIEFTPETVNGVPVTVTREVDIDLGFAYE